MLSNGGQPGKLSLNLTFPATNQPIRVMGTPDEPEWIAKDVCDVLGISAPAQVLRGFAEDEKGVCTIHTPGGPQDMLTVTEPGLYRLVLKSRKPAAKTFKRWICHDVLPSIRRQGCYAPAVVSKNPTSVMLRQLADSLERQDELETRQQEQATKLEVLAGKVTDMDGDTRYSTVLAYAREKRLDMPVKEAVEHGKALARIHRQRKIRIGRVPDERYGHVNSYRIDVMEEYFGE